MPVIDTSIDRVGCSLTITADYAGVESEVFDIYTDAQAIERIWGPPMYPATFVAHTLSPGRRSAYYLSGPYGDFYPGWLRIRTVDAPFRFAFDEGYADGAFNALPGTPVAHTEYTFHRVGSRTRVTVFSEWATVQELDAVISMGGVEGTASAMDQIDALLRIRRRQAALAAYR